MNGRSALSVLNGLNNVASPTPTLTLETSLHSRAIQDFADTLCQIAPKLSVVAYGREYTYIDKLERQNDEGSPRQCFIRDQSRDSNSSAPAATIAVPNDPKLVRCMIPESDLLDRKFEYR